MRIRAADTELPPAQAPTLHSLLVEIVVIHWETRPGSSR